MKISKYINKISKELQVNKILGHGICYFNKAMPAQECSNSSSKFLRHGGVVVDNSISVKNNFTFSPQTLKRLFLKDKLLGKRNGIIRSCGK